MIRRPDPARLADLLAISRLRDLTPREMLALDSLFAAEARHRRRLERRRDRLKTRVARLQHRLAKIEEQLR